jgi:hypothetical protein
MQQYICYSLKLNFKKEKKCYTYILLILFFFVFSKVFCEYIVFYCVCVHVYGKKRAIDPSQRKKRTQTITFQADTK